MAVRPGYKRTEVGVLPEDWDSRNFDEVGKVIDGDRGINYPSRVEFLDSGYCLFLNAKNVTKRGFEFSECSFITQAKDSLLTKGKLVRGDIVLTTRGTVGNVAFFDDFVPFENIRINSGMVVLRNEGANLVTAYLYKVLQSRLVQNQVDRFVFGSAQPQLTVRLIQTFQIPLPSLPEQQAIAAVLSDVDALISALDKLIAKKRDIKKAAMQQLLTGKKRLPGFSGEWNRASIEHLENIGLLRLSRGKVISKEDFKNNPGDYPVYSSSVKNNGLFGRYGDYMFDEELITWSVDGGGDFFYRHKHRFSVTNVSGFMRVDTSRIDYRFLAAELQILHGRLAFDYQIKAHPSVIRKAYAPSIPSLLEQRAIAAVLSDMDAEIAALERRRDKTRALKQGMMQELLTGRIRLI